jgi:hypothetical protein
MLSEKRYYSISLEMLLDSGFPQGLVKPNAAARRGAVNTKDPAWVLAPDMGR